MKRSHQFILGLLLSIAVFAPARDLSAETPPNIVVILGDDQAWMDYGFMGRSVIKTPHLDRLAARSVVFKRGYVSSPVCRPSLASLLTGKFPHEHGITGNDVDGPNRRAELDLPVRAKFHEMPSFVKALSSKGYLAHQSGKWWEGSYQDGGFTHGMTHGDPKRGGRHGDEGLSIGREGMEPVTDFIDHAVGEKKPFLLWYAPFMPHTPHNPPQRLLDKYLEKGRAEDVAKYYAMCEWFDETCGQVFAHLDKKGLTENTLVLFICDNGWVATSTNNDDPNQKSWKGYALRSKGSPFENGIRNPILISWPAKLKPESSSDLAHTIDFYPTIAAAVGMDAPKDLTGINLLDAEARKKRDAVFGVCNSVYNMSPDDPDATLQYLWCVEHEWKLMVRYDGKDTTHYRNIHIWDEARVRLYNLKLDPHEKNEVSDQNPEVVERMRKRIAAWHPVKTDE